MALPATDAFTSATEQGLATYSASWTVNLGDFKVLASNGGATGFRSVNESGARWNADTPNADQYSQGTLVTEGDWAAMGVAVRVQTTTGNYYGFYDDTGNTYLFKVVSSTLTQFGAAGTSVSVGVVLRLEVSSNTLTAKVNGSTWTSVGTSGQATDSAFSSGYVGLAGWGDSKATALDNWEGGNLGAAAAKSRPVFQSGPRFFGARFR